MSNNIDPKFLPSANALKAVGLQVSQIRKDDDVLHLITESIQSINKHENQIAVAIYIMVQRGWEYSALTARTGMAERTLRNKHIEGLAILRTGEVTRTTSAIRTGSLSMKVVDELTAGTGDSASKIDKLEQAAFSSTVRSKFQSDDGTEVSNEQLRDLFAKTKEAVEVMEQPAVAGNLVNALPYVTADAGVTLKEEKRSGHNQGGSDAPNTIEFHLKAALKDARKIAEDSGMAYVPTPADVSALLSLCSFMDIQLDLEPEVAAAIEALAY